MKKFELSERVDSKKVFIIQSSQLEGRLDVDFYKPEILALEYKVRSKASGKLSKYIAKIASGSTPSKTEEHKYYTTSELGIPFLRVQNLCVNGEISFTGLKYINEETHEGLLKRSQVYGGDLLVKITGVGRMAIASVAPENFIANTNQHMVVIKPKNISSKYLAQYLNLDLVEKLASRRSTGGTRPALDYPALKSIPIIENIDFSKLNDAYLKQKRILKEANEKLASIDAYLLEKLGVKLPRQEKQLKSRIFIRNYTEIMQSRWDSYFHQKHFINFHDELNNSIYPVIDLKNLSKKITSGITPKSGGDAYVSSDDGIPFIRSGDINIDGNLDYSNLLYIKEEIHNKEMNSSKLQKNDLMIAIVGATIGQIGIYLGKDEANINQAIALVRLKDDLNPFFFKELIKSSIGQWNLNHLKRPVARANINLEEISTMRLIVPPIEIQDELVEHIQKIRDEAKKLETEANLVLEKAKQEIEKMILGETE
ncbi:restriction endonuclease subunit S [Acinetobacter pittii]|uniref:restriction endonuclease subunit S n=1 Tax=Acinetobacter pittii TaxID=48296 RepID=UPI003007FF9E